MTVAIYDSAGGGYCYTSYLFSLALEPSAGYGLSSTRFLDHTQVRTTVGRTTLDE
jgi:hypothetical protein